MLALFRPFFGSISFHVVLVLILFIGGISQVKKIKRKVREAPIIQVDLSNIKIKKVSFATSVKENKVKKTVESKKVVKEKKVKIQSKEVVKKIKHIEKEEKPIKKEEKKKPVVKKIVKKYVPKPEVARPRAVKRIENGEHKNKAIKKTSLHDLSLSAKDALRVRIRQCWNIDPTRKYPKGLTFQVTAYLNESGEVYRTHAHTIANDPLMAHLNASAVRAIELCAPYDFLPQDQYEKWKEVEITFDPANNTIN